MVKEAGILSKESGACPELNSRLLGRGSPPGSPRAP